jgi:hypothetical protein
MKKILLLVLALAAAGAVAYLLNAKRSAPSNDEPSRSFDAFPDVVQKDAAEASA